MSVLIEALCLVIPRQVLDVSFPGGTELFLREYRADASLRYVVADEQLVAVSVYDPETLTPMVERFKEFGMVEADDDLNAQEFVLVDMHMGPALACHWLTFDRHQHGMGLAWLATTEPATLAVPDFWTPESSWSLQRTDIRDDGPDNVLPLSSENGMEALLDFRTGKVMLGKDTRSTVEHVGPATVIPETPRQPSWMDERLIAAKRLLDGLGLAYSTDSARNELSVVFALDDDPLDPDGINCNRRLYIILRPSKLVDEIIFETCVPETFGPNGLFAHNDAELRERIDEHLVGELYEVRHDLDTGTISIVSRRPRSGDEPWEQTIESGFTRASHLGTIVFYAFDGPARPINDDLDSDDEDDNMPTLEDILGRR